MHKCKWNPSALHWSEADGNMFSVDPDVDVDVSPMYAAQWTARLSFLSKALTFAPLDTSNWTICSDRETTHYTMNTKLEVLFI